MWGEIAHACFRNQVLLSKASHLFKLINDFLAFYFFGIQLNVIYRCSFQEWMNGIFGSLFFFYNCVFMDYMFVIGLLLCFCSSIFELIWDKLHVDIYLGFDISYLVLATLSILFGLFVWVIIILLSYNLYNLLIIRRRENKNTNS